ncbi:hypothetical protein WEB32_04100 [Streptomyces netropsis]|uniref:Uncharacterized protein n=1 Tax=Streptomyces netropsis TaxID=55404 RepID=A0A7W7LBV4_STRNE|nr:hypothetical protein [Streptomyces netropsis]MBB4887363.1 hypothetical protein [Streptomyces netropsis]GGR09761.1 hypothetical protein GCM10010219_12920 [Streptomyces netropsis]
MTQPTAAGDVPRFSVHFHDNHIPAAPAGLYEIALDHTVSGEKVGTDSLPTARQDFEIRSPQFTLDGSFVHAVHPAPAASGAFEYVLPHITLGRLILPWERALDPAKPELPWLALLLFAEQELPDDPKAQGHVRTRTVRELLTATGDVLVPDITLEEEVPPELRDASCATIDVPSDVFAALVPRRADLPYLCHVRKVTDRHALRVRRNGEKLEVGDYSVVVANRFPRTAGRYAAHLVSLEGFAGHLDGTRPAPSVVRMVSLRAWSFEAVPDASAHFDALIRHMADDPAGLGLRLRPRTAGTAASPATERLDLGYVPVDHGLPSAEHTFAWYRGPFTPVVAQDVPTPATGHYAHADEALVYLTDAGVFDVSYAAAFTLGRALAMSDSTLAATVSAFRARARRLAQRALMRDRTGPHPARDRFHELIDEGLGARLHAAATSLPGTRTAPVPAPRRAAGGVPRPPAVTDLRNRLRSGATREVLLHALREPLAPLLSALDQVTLLAAAPLGHLVPDARMLPPESLRFFHVDAQWCAALRDGVLSTGLGTSLDVAVNDLAREALDEPPKLSGLLMRSALVKNWPDVVIEPRRAVTGDDFDLLDIVHRAAIGPDLLLCLVDGVPDQVVFREPSEGIHFGIDEGDRIGLRRLTDPVGDSLVGESVPRAGEGDITRFLRPATDTGTAEVLDLDAGADPLVPAVAAALRTLGELGPDDALSPGALAVELVNAPQRIVFDPNRPGQQ